jgi:hypothetical protein
MCFRVITLFAVSVGLVFSQSAEITFPSPGFSFPDGTTSTTFTSTCTGCPTAITAEYLVGEQSQGILWTPPFSMPWDPYYVFNGSQHQVYVIYRDTLGTIVATSPRTTFSTANTWPVDPVSPASLSCSMTSSTPVTSTWSGNSITVSGAITGTTVTAGHASTLFYVDSWSVGNKSGGAPSQTIPTTQFANGNHLVLAVTRDTSLGSAPMGCQWGPFLVNFQNGATAMDLLANPAEFYLALGATQQMTATILNTDLSTSTSAGTLTYTSVDTTICIVTSGGLVTALNPPQGAGSSGGLCQISITTSLIPSPLSPRVSYGFVTPQNQLAHFGNDGQKYTSYQPGVSVWEAGMFFCDKGWLDYLAYNNTILSSSQWFNLLTASGFNTCDTGNTGAPGGSTLTTASQSLLQSDLGAAFTTVKSLMNPNNAAVWPIRPHIILTGALSDDNSIWPWINPNPSTFSPSGLSLLFQQFSGVGAQYSSVDEITNNLGGNANPHPFFQAGGASACSTAYGVDCLVSITCDGAGNGTVNWNSPYPGNGSSTFGIFGATGHPSLNTTVGGPLYKISTSGANSFSWVDANSKFGATTACSTAFTADQTTDPGLHVEAFINAWQAGGTSYLPSTWMSTVRAAQAAAIPRPLLSNPAQAGASANQNYNWMSNPLAADFAELYFNDSNNFVFYTPTHAAISYILNDNGIVARKKWSSLRANTPFLSSTNGTQLNYGLSGVPTQIASIAGNLVTFTGPHGVSNCLGGVSRGTISGVSGTNAAYYNNDFFIEACPTTATMTISPRIPLGLGGTLPNMTNLHCSSNCGTIVFSNGDQFTTNSIKPCNNSGSTCQAGAPGTSQGSVALSGVSNLIGLQHRGMTFVVSGMTGGTGGTTGQANAYYNCASSSSPGVCGNGNGNTFYLTWDSCSNPNNACYGNLFWREVPPPSFTATGGTFSIIADNNVLYGRNQIHNFQPNPEVTFLSDLETMVAGGAGMRQYGLGSISSNTSAAGQVPNFSVDVNFGTQAEISPIYFQTAWTQQAWYAASIVNLLLNRLAPYWAQSRCGSADLGFLFDDTCRTGSLGNLNVHVNFSDVSQTRNVDLTNCAVAGQQTIRYMASWNGVIITTLAPGTTVDANAVFPPASAAFYLCSKNAAAEYSPPTLGLRLADVARAAKVAVRYSYQPFLLTQQTSNVIDCGNGASCKLPVDRNLGVIYYRVEYLDSSGQPLATGDLQVIN